MYIEKGVKDLVKRVMGMKNLSVSNNETFVSLGADSFDKVDMLMDLEEQFGIDVDEGEWASVKTVQDIIDLIRKLTKGE